MDLITCKNISFVYDGVPAVKDLDFSVEPNDYLCIVGENGAGKSTLVKGLLRLKKPASVGPRSMRHEKGDFIG